VIDVKQDEIRSRPVSRSSQKTPPSYRLKVDQADGFHKSPDRVFAKEALINRDFASSGAHEAALEAAMKRREAHRSVSPASPDLNGNEPAFTVLESFKVNGDITSNCNNIAVL